VIWYLGADQTPFWKWAPFWFGKTGENFKTSTNPSVLIWIRLIFLWTTLLTLCIWSIWNVQPYYYCTVNKFKNMYDNYSFVQVILIPALVQILNRFTPVFIFFLRFDSIGKFIRGKPMGKNKIYNKISSL
jgi:hypothetical protein